MPPIKKSSKKARSKRQRPILQFLKSFEQNLNPNTEWRWFKNYLRRRQQRRKDQVSSVRHRPISDLQQVVQTRWRKWQVRRQRQPKQSQSTLMRWAIPTVKEAMSTRDGVVLLLRRACSALLLLVIGSLALNALPIRLGGPEWYLQVLAFIAENVPVIILASSLSLLSIYISTNEATSIAYRRRAMRISRFTRGLAVLLIPLQLVFTTWLYGQAFSNNRTQLAAIRANADALIKGAQQTTTNQEFVGYLRSRNMTGNLDSIASAPLAQVKSEFVRTIQMSQRQQEQSLSATTRSTLLRYTTNAIKLLFSLVILVTFLGLYHQILKRTPVPRESNEAPRPTIELQGLTMD